MMHTWLDQGVIWLQKMVDGDGTRKALVISLIDMEEIDLLYT